MHSSAKRGIDNECRLSVCDVGGSGSHRLEILETNCVDNWPNTFARSTYSQGNIWKFWGDYRSGVGKSGVTVTAARNRLWVVAPSTLTGRQR